MIYDTLCLSSGGIYGLSYIGALDYLINEKILNLNNIKNFAGTSIGSVILFFIIIGSPFVCYGKDPNCFQTHSNYYTHSPILYPLHPLI